ncbi:HlyD family type I secretion periplasmic adaptor subunit [Sphingobium algorifonticola]|uniref:Membrane fusion protein (MFP) family protein n=1 Tax=Sphingobium algorifonticola TaxID=2008318 RepID=A0A437JCT0_9SPHN|nr:HlyD family type I secretion periplasmic adaptor subunit [Sphingobium algorifonticola]RVT43563.1 HlyD family type I secretion periplasmic adaptor subunit [Sphingobium algorifonticola]
MFFTAIRDRIIRAFGGASLYEGVSSRELAAAFAGDMKVSSAPIDGIAPWSARVRTDGQTRVLKVLGFLVVAFLAWAILFQVDKVTRGAGRVLPSVQNQVVQHLEGGIVKELLVQEGQRVRKGQILMKVSNQFTIAEFENARTDVIAKKITLARMEAEVSGASSFTVPEELARVAPEIAASEEALFYSSRNQRGQESGIISEQARARRAEIAGLQSRLGNLRKEQTLMMTQLDKLERAYQAEAISEREVLEKRSALLALQTRIADVQSQIPQAMAQLSESTARKGEIWTKSVQETKAEAARLRMELAKADETLGAYTDKESREEIRAPMAGIVNKLYVQTVGGVIRGGEPIVEIVPVDKVVMVEARIAPKDRGQVWAGLPANIKISAYDSAIYGGLDGQVVDVSPDVIQDAKGEVFYRVRLRADTTRFGRGKPVIPGMTAEVNIKSGRQTIMDYILGPLIRIRDSAMRE